MKTNKNAVRFSHCVNYWQDKNCFTTCHIIRYSIYVQISVKWSVLGDFVFFRTFDKWHIEQPEDKGVLNKVVLHRQGVVQTENTR